MNNIGTGGNNFYPRERFLINDLDAFFAGVYLDGTQPNQKTLLLKKLGFNLNSHNVGGASLNVEYLKQTTIAGQVRVVSYDFNTDCPCHDCEYDYGINIVIRHRIPGYFNDFEQQQYKPYAGMIKNMKSACVSGAINPTVLNTMKDDIINQINADLGYMNQWAGANVIAGRMYKLTTPGAWDNTATITINGTPYGAAATAAAMVVLINAGTDAFAYVDPLAQLLNIYIMANSTPTTFVVTSTGAIVVPATYTIGIQSKSVDWTFEVDTEHLDATGIVVEVQPQKWSFLTSDDVFRDFAGGTNAAGAIPGNGDLQSQVYGMQPVQGATYLKYIIHVEGQQNEIHGAGTYSSQKRIIDLYIMNVAANIGNVFDAGYMKNPTDAGFAAAVTFDQLLTYWTT